MPKRPKSKRRELSKKLRDILKRIAEVAEQAERRRRERVRYEWWHKNRPYD